MIEGMLARVSALVLGLVAACQPSVESSPDAAPRPDAPRGVEPESPDYVRLRGTLTTTPAVHTVHQFLRLLVSTSYLPMTHSTC